MASILQIIWNTNPLFSLSRTVPANYYPSTSPWSRMSTGCGWNCWSWTNSQTYLTQRRTAWRPLEFWTRTSRCRIPGQSLCLTIQVSNFFYLASLLLYNSFHVFVCLINKIIPFYKSWNIFNIFLTCKHFYWKNSKL